MKDAEKTKEQLINELLEFRQRLAELGASEIKRRQEEEKRERLFRQVEAESTCLQAVLQQIPVGIIIAEAPSGRPILANKQVEKIWRHSFAPAKEFKPYRGYRGFHFDGRPYKPEEWPLIRSIQKGEVVVSEEIEFRRGNGSRGVMQVSSTPIRDRDGSITAGVMIFNEVTERKQAEEELQKHREHLEELVEQRTRELVNAQDKLVRSERLVVLGQLAGGIGHELRNPLGAIKNAAYFLNMALERPEPEVKETLGILEREVATSERIVSSLLDFARPKPPTRRKVNINEVVREVLSFATVPENVKVVRQLDESLPAVMADPDQLGQVFANIIRNAIQAMPEGGQLIVTSEVFRPGWVAISFTDTGVGIPPEEQQKVFEPLFTTKARGIGLGLAVTNTLVEGHGGTVEVKSKVGKGSTFTVRLPIRKEE